jgi:hypothetical protein
MYICGFAFLPNEVSADETGPEITNIHHIPKYPMYGDNVTVYATITDPDGIPPDGVHLTYCAGDVCLFPVVMSGPDLNDVYWAIIPWDGSNMDNGTVVHYNIQADDNNSNTTITSEIYYFYVSEIELTTEMVDTTYVSESIWINGSALYNGNETAPVEYSNITVKIVGTSDEYYSMTDGNGNFSMELVFDSPGEYQINVTITNRTLKAYSEESVNVIGISYFSLEVQLTTCYPNQEMWVNGTARYYTGDPVINSDVVIRINDTLVNTTKTDSTGNYSFLITVPEELGLYIVNVTVMNGSLVAYNETSISVTERPLPDLAIDTEDISFIHAYSSPVVDEEVNITVTVHNYGLENCSDVTVSFYDGPPNGENLIGSDTITQISIGSTDNCNVMWSAINGTHEIWIVVDPENNTEESFENNNNASKAIFVDDDFDDDGIGNAEDPDDDNDNYNDDIDAFPYNPTEWVDNDEDDIGDNADPDDDNDGLLDTEEDQNGDERIEGDTNNDRIWDDNEDWKETDPLNDDTDGDDVNDKEDYDPLDPNVWEKPSSETPWLIIALIVIVIIIVVLIVVLLMLRKRKGKTAM